MKNHVGVWTLLLTLLTIGASNVPAKQPPRVPPLGSEKVITITNIQVDPAQVTIDRGDVVVWTFPEQPGTVVLTPGSYPSKRIPPGGWLSLYFIEAGTYEYRVFLCGDGASVVGPAVLAGRVYGFTPRGHSQMLERFVDQIGLEYFIIMVQDCGGPIGLGLVGRRPELVRGLIIGNTWAWSIQGDPHFERFSKFMGGPIGRFLILNFNAFVNVLLRGSVRRRLSREVMVLYRAPFRRREDRLPTYIFPREIRHSRGFLEEVEAGLERLRDRPALIIWGAKDPAFRPKERDRFGAIFPNHRMVILEEAGRFIQEDAPEQIASAIRSWWQAQS